MIRRSAVDCNEHPAARTSSSGAATEPEFTDDESVGTVEQLVTPTRLAGGPPQVSLQLRASEPALAPSGHAGGQGGAAGRQRARNRQRQWIFARGQRPGSTYAGVVSAPAENRRPTAEAAPIVEPEIAPAVPSFDEGVEESLEVVGEESGPSFSEPAVASAESTVEQFEPEIFEPIFTPEPAFAPAQEFTPEPQFMAPEPAVASAAAADWEETAADAVPERSQRSLRNSRPGPRQSQSQTRRNQQPWRNRNRSLHSRTPRRKSMSPLARGNPCRI